MTMRSKEDRQRAKLEKKVALVRQRIAEMERLFEHRYGKRELPNNDEGRRMFRIMAEHIAAQVDAEHDLAVFNFATAVMSDKADAIDEAVKAITQLHGDGEDVQQSIRNAMSGISILRSR